MKDELADITVLLDRSGSMEDCKSDVVGGINVLIEQHKKAAGSAVFSLIQFDSFEPYMATYSAVPIQDVKPLTSDDFVPRGSTPLYDAMAETIKKKGDRLLAIPEQDRPGKVIVIIFTDGEENSSKVATLSAVEAAVKHQQEKYNWQFIFLGADIDAMKAGNQLGLKRGTVMDINKRNAFSSMVMTADNTVSYRATGNVQDLNYTEQQRVAAALDSFTGGSKNQ